RSGDTMLRLTPKVAEIVSPTVRLTGNDFIGFKTDKKVRFDAKEEVRIVSKKDLFCFADNRAMVKGKKGELSLDDHARLDGDTVKLNCTPDPGDAPPDDPIKKLTRFTLKDQDGKPIAKQRVVMVMQDGSEISGILDKEGKLEMYLEESGELF